LNTFDARISEYAETKFARDGIELVTNARVTEVRPNEASVMDKRTKKVTKIPFGVCVWSTGLGTHALARELKRQAGQNMRRRAIAVDKYLQVRGVRRATGKPEMRGTVYALGDCADVKSKAAAGSELLDRADELFALADADDNGTVDKEEFRAVMRSLGERYPHLATFTKGGSDSRLTDIMDTFDVSKDAALNRTEVRPMQTFFTRPSVSTFDRFSFQLTGELFFYGTTRTVPRRDGGSGRAVDLAPEHGAGGEPARGVSRAGAQRAGEGEEERRNGRVPTV
jgi:NADH:ubiquinone reductase (non-electrogenic)